MKNTRECSRESAPSRWGWHCAAAAMVLSLPGPLLAAPQRISGRVVDAEGRPVSDVRVSHYWAWTGTGEFSPGPVLTLDEDGQFEGTLEFYGRPQGLVAYSSDGLLAGIAIVQPDASTEVKIILAPSVPVEARLGCSELDGDLGWVNSYWMPESGVRPIMATPKDGELHLRLPQHPKWNYWFYGRNVKSVSKEMQMEARDPLSMDLGEIDFKATYIALNIGRKAEQWTVTDARGVSIDEAQVDDFKGQWLLVEFWGFW